MKKIENLLNKKKNKIIFFITFDILVLICSSFLAIGLRFDFELIPNYYLLNSFLYLGFDILIMLIVFSCMKLYTSVWTYASVTEMMKVFLGCSLTEVLTCFYKTILNIRMPRSYYLIQLMILILFIGGIRFSFRIARAFIIYKNNKIKQNKTMIIGAGSAGRLLIDEINNNKKNDNSIACIIDDDKEKVGTYIKNIPIVGNRKDIEKNCQKYKIKEIIIAIPSASKETISLIVDECQKTKCNIKILPNLYSLLNDSDDETADNLYKKVRPLSYDDFLGRNEIIVNNEEISDNIKNKVILVTGGGGSIGSELCRQIAKNNPKLLIIFDIYENNAYEIEQELVRKYPNMNLKVIIGSVRDYDRLEKVFKDYRPEMVFHAAAHKHVPLMEHSPNEAIKNNCLGTLNTVKLADKYKTKKFVLISTDKAVRPTNVMGASKRICEMIIQTYDKISKNTDYVAVRFGNVLGSNGSVIPLFLKQIEEGGPVTVTDKNITRFFMTIPEAVNLILQASVYALGGEIFVLDMGEPVKIYDLAKKIIRYKGLEPGIDIEIKITGLRPGEKLYEERLMEEEGLKKTPNELINIGMPLEIEKDFLKDLDDLIKSSYKNKDDIKDKVAKIVTTYKVDKRDEY